MMKDPFASPSLKMMQPNVVRVINMEQMLSRRRANQREIIRKRNHASEKRHKMKNITNAQQQHRNFVPTHAADSSAVFLLDQRMNERSVSFHRRHEGKDF